MSDAVRLNHLTHMTHTVLAEDTLLLLLGAYGATVSHSLCHGTPAVPGLDHAAAWEAAAAARGRPLRSIEVRRHRLLAQRLQPTPTTLFGRPRDRVMRLPGDLVATMFRPGMAGA